MAKAIIEITVMVLAQFLWAAFAFGPMLRARTIILHGWDLSSKKSIFITFKACLGAILLTFAFLFWLQSYFTFSGLESKLLGTLVWATLWYFISVNGVLKLANTENLINLSVARKVVWSSFLFVTLGSLASGAILALIAISYRAISGW